MPEQNNTIMIQEKKEETMLESDRLLELANYAEKRIEAINKIKSIVLKVTNKNDWIDQNGKPYLTSAGCHKLANLFGISWRFIGEPKKVVEEDGHYRFEVALELVMGSRSIEVIGTRSTRDPFFTTRYQGGQKIILPPSEIDGGDVLKAAITNAQGNGISAILGIRNLTWDDLKNAGIRLGEIKKVEYRQSEMNNEIIELRDKIDRMLSEMAKDSKVEYAKLLTKYSSFVAKDGKEIQGKTSLSSLTEKQIPAVYNRVKRAYENWEKEEEDGNEN